MKSPAPPACTDKIITRAALDTLSDIYRHFLTLHG